MNMPALEIDGERFEYTDFYPLDECIGRMYIGSLYGINENTPAFKGTPIGRRYMPNKSVGVVNVFRRNPDGSITGIQGIFKKYIWTVTESGDPLFRVSERIA